MLDIGSSDGALYERIRNLGQYVGMNTGLDSDRLLGANARLIRGMFPRDLNDHAPFDTICMLAVVEHIPPDAHATLARECFEHLRVGGYLLVTVPSPRADGVLNVLRFLRVINGISLNQHYGFRPKQTAQLFERAGLRMVKKRRFELGFNTLFVFQRP